MKTVIKKTKNKINNNNEITKINKVIHKRKDTHTYNSQDASTANELMKYIQSMVPAFSDRVRKEGLKVHGHYTLYEASSLFVILFEVFQHDTSERYYVGPSGTYLIF